jgi:ubiquinone/menaquinone biosynthesis C-methylase UbiE
MAIPEPHHALSLAPPHNHSPEEERLLETTRSRFDRPEVAREYRARKNVLTPRNLREWQCMEKALHGIGAGAAVLDLPCGSGRLEPLLEAKGYRVTAADFSGHMLQQAVDAYLASSGRRELPPEVRFLQRDVMQTGFADGEFDAVICNRLLHHFPTPGLRRQALTELARITKGVVVISYFSNFALSALRFHLKNRLANRHPTDRIPIWFSTLEQDLAAAGLRCTGTFPVRLGLSPQTYLRLEKP